MRRSDLEKLSMGRLRELAPGVKTTRKVVLIDSILNDELVPKSDEVAVEVTADTTTLEYSNRIRLNFDRRFIPLLRRETGCDCLIENYEYFIGGITLIDVNFQKVLNDVYMNMTGEKVDMSTCGSCINNRLARIRNEYIKLIG